MKTRSGRFTFTFAAALLALVSLPTVGTGCASPPHEDLPQEDIGTAAEALTSDLTEDAPDMPESDVQAVMNWIKNKVTGEKLPFCWRQSSGRGVGVPLSECGPGEEKDGLLCYPTCDSGFKGVGPVCWQSCPTDRGFTEGGVSCMKPAAYGRGVGRVPDVTCPPGFSQRGVGAAAWCDNGPTWPWKLQTRAATASCAANEEMNAGLCYTQCQAGYHAVGSNICSPDCTGMASDDGVSCSKKTQPRGAGRPMRCAPGLVEDAGLCYPACSPGFDGAGPVCWQSCQPGWANCGAGCAKTSTECASVVADQVIAPLVVVANVASFGLGSEVKAVAGVEKTVKTIVVGGKKITDSTKVGKAFIGVVDLLQSVNPAGLQKDATVVRRIFQAKFGSVRKVATTTFRVNRSIYKAERDFEKAFSDDFAILTSKEINDEIDRRFAPDTAKYLKSRWANEQLQVMAGAEGMKIAQDVLSFVSIVDITGVTGVVAAYTKPICQDVISFPTLSRP